jgi:hypothetical protein
MISHHMKNTKFASLKAITVISFILYALSCQRGAAQIDPASGLTVGALLNQMMDQVQQAISDARNAGSSLEMQMGQEANLAIANAQNTYATSLNMTFKDVDKTMQTSLDQIQSLANGVTDKTYKKLDDVTASVQQIVNALPFRAHEPQLTKVSPEFVVPAEQTYLVPLQFKGNFEFSAEKNFEPVLIINGHRYSCSENTVQNLKFMVPVSDIFPIDASALSANKFSYVTSDLTIPWKESKIFGLINHVHSNIYHVIIGALPASPGEITLIHTVSRVVPVTKQYQGPNHHQCSDSNCGNNDDINHDWEDDPDSNWHVVQHTAQAHAGGHGVYSGPDLVSDSGDKVIYRATTIHKKWGSSGVLDFSVTFTETQDSTVNDTITEPVKLNWGDSQVINYPIGSWTLIFNGFDGSHSEFKGADNSNRYLTIVSEGGSNKVQITSPSDVSF